ncbi:MAG: hypothetical protein GXX90_08620 [Microbacteriaceae bacterium]|nr:hypothetical protein [Microbacteriaceae bacterium]
MRSERIGTGIVWGASLLAAVLIGLLAGDDRRLAWVSIAMLMLVFVAAIVHLVIAKPEGFIHRMTVSLGGAAVVLTAASLVFLLTGAHGIVVIGG